LSHFFLALFSGDTSAFALAVLFARRGVMSLDHAAITPSEIAAAARRIAGHVRVTPMMQIDGAGFGLAHPVNLKLELLQHAGSFKPRGAFNNLLSRPIPAAGVAAASGGNHGAAVAYAAGALGHQARIFVPEIASPAKIDAIRRFGADVVVGGARYADALAACDAYCATSGALSIHAYDAPETIAGQGTVALEWLEQSPELDTVLIAVGGGGLIAGIAAFLAGHAGHKVKVVGVEPEGSCALHASLAAGKPVDVEVNSVAADSLGARNTGELVFAIARAHVGHVALVPDDAITLAQKLCWLNLRLAVEPGGAAALAALLCGAYRPARGERVGVLMCGANIDLSKLAVITG
jgi:threonine dehydratase